MIFTMEWFKATLMRALHTFAQTAISLITVGQMFSQINWIEILSVSGVAALLSILKCIVAGTPETTTNGSIIISENEDGAAYQFSFDDKEFENIPTNKIIKMNVINDTQKTE